MPVEIPSDAFESLAVRLRTDADAPSLTEAALQLAAEFRDGVSFEEAERRLGALADAVDARLDRSAPGEAQLRTLIETLHNEQGLRGNEDAYQDVRNSDLDLVLERRLGIPITLALVYIDVGTRVGIPMEGISFPQHFLVRSRAPAELLIDPFHGRVLDDAECRARLEQAMGKGARFDRQALRAATKREILVRMLTNLKHVFIGERRLPEAIGCSSRILLLAPEVVSEWRDRGLLYEALECFQPALSDLEHFLAHAPQAPGADAVRERIDGLRARAASIH